MHKPRPHLLLVDDEASIREPLGKYLERQGFRVTDAASASTARSVLLSYDIDMVLLDIMMPGEDGLSLCRHIAAHEGPPVILLTAKSEETDRIIGLEIGADDYVTKPFGTAELLARLTVIQRRRFTRQSAEIVVGTLKLDLLHHEASLDEAPLKLTPTEFALLKVLAEHAGRIVTQNQIMKQVWAGQSSDPSEGLRVHINHLRKKLGEAGPRIVNEPGIGYRLVAE